MNIVFISKLSGRLSTGPSNSVPKQVNAQAAVDNVFWYNLNYVCRDEWKTGAVPCHTLDEYPGGSISALPEPFNNPDLVVYEGFYEFPFDKTVFELKRRKIPYIIIPRGSMTERAQSQKRLKKIFGNLVFFNSFYRGSAAVHFLTNRERDDSKGFNSSTCVILPNGITARTRSRVAVEHEGIRGVSIGRLDIDHKGLDLLLNAVEIAQDIMREASFCINLYGPSENGSAEQLEKDAIEKGITDLVTINPPVFGPDKDKLLENSDLFVITSRYEGHPMSMLEALSYGLPCLATDGSNMKGEVDCAKAGWTSDNSAEGIAASISEICENKSELIERGRNGLELSRMYEWKQIAHRTHDEYEHCLN